MDMLLAAVLALAQQGSAAPSSLPPGSFILPKVTCPPSAEETERLLALPFEEFDQRGDSGWRPYGLNGCYREAADLIGRYLEKHPQAHPVLPWHRFQMLAHADDTAEALSVLEGIRASAQWAAADEGWRGYVEGTEAFMRGRKPDLEARLAALDRFGSGTHPAAGAARLNANVLRGLLRCFGQPYRVAYASPCVDMEAARTISNELSLERR